MSGTEIRLSSNEQGTGHIFKYLEVDYDYLDVYDLELVAGRNFSRDYPVDTTGQSVIINEAAIKDLGLKDSNEAINEYLSYNYNMDKMNIIGVVKNYNQENLKSEIQPMIIFLRPINAEYISVTVKQAELSGVIGTIQKQYSAFYPESIFEYFVLKDFYSSEFENDENYNIVLTVFCMIAACIACLGLFALSTYSAKKRTKEFSIRLMLGSTLSSVIILFIKREINVVLIASVVAIPFAYWIFSRWLQNFPYRIELGWWFFVLPMLLALAFAIIILLKNVIRISKISPVKALKIE
jgi:putative ABC transport system permease protein